MITKLLSIIFVRLGYFFPPRGLQTCAQRLNDHKTWSSICCQDITVFVSVEKLQLLIFPIQILLTPSIRWILVTFCADHPACDLCASESRSKNGVSLCIKLLSRKKFWLDTFPFSKLVNNNKQSSTIIPEKYKTFFFNDNSYL